MSDTVDDVGIHDYDAVLSGDYSLDIATRVLTLTSSSGKADTRYILPSSSEWLLIETHNVDGVYGKLGYHKLTLDTSNIVDEISSAYNISNIQYSAFNMTATHYYGNVTADVYYGDENNTPSLYCSGIDFIPDIESWKLNIDTLIPMTPPIYLLTEPIITKFGSPDTYYVNNSSCSDFFLDGALEHSSQSIFPEGTPWLPTSGQYPEDGTIELSATGNSIRRIDTQWIPPKNNVWTVTGIYNVVMGTSYDMYAIHYKGNGYADIYIGSESISIYKKYEDITYIPQSTSWLITEDPPTEITLDKITYDMDDFYEA